MKFLVTYICDICGFGSTSEAAVSQCEAQGYPPQALAVGSTHETIPGNRISVVSTYISSEQGTKKHTRRYQVDVFLKRKEDEPTTQIDISEHYLLQMLKLEKSLV